MNLHYLAAIGRGIRLCGGSLALLSVVALNATGGAAAPLVVSSSEITVRVRILETKSRQTLKDKSGVVIWLVPIDGPQKSRFGTWEPLYRMAQRNKTFEPHLLVVPVGSKVEFSNLDPWLHDAFSISGSRQFDLGFFRTGVRNVEFDRAGVSYVFCRIHPGMEAVVLTVESPYFGISDRAGRVSISKVPAGKYRLHVWYEDASPRALDALQSPVVVVDERCSLPAISIAVARRKTLRYGEMHQ